MKLLDFLGLAPRPAADPELDPLAAELVTARGPLEPAPALIPCADCTEPHFPDTLRRRYVTPDCIMHFCPACAAKAVWALCPPVE